jgi:hypothetical protein
MQYPSEKKSGYHSPTDPCTPAFAAYAANIECSRDGGPPPDSGLDAGHDAEAGVDATVDAGSGADATPEAAVDPRSPWNSSSSSSA